MTEQFFFKWDGHTHSELCPHGSREKTVELIEKAIQYNFTHYTISEHAPLPDQLLENQQIQSELVLSQNELIPYLKHATELKKIYAGKINILVGLEFDYIEGHEEFTNNLLEEVHHFLDDSLLSLHLIPGKQGLRAIDYSPEDFQEGLIDYYGNIEKVHQVYWEKILKMLNADLGIYKPKRVGHLALINKFIHVFPVNSYIQKNTENILEKTIFPVLANNKYALDFNMAGLKVPQCKQIYITPFMLQLCRTYSIPVVYGSDAHGTKSVGHYYEEYKTLQEKKYELTEVIPKRNQ